MGGVPNFEITIYGGAKLENFIYGGGCQLDQGKIDFLPSAAGARRKSLATKNEYPEKRLDVIYPNMQ